jgi:hypothetical protein
MSELYCPFCDRIVSVPEQFPLMLIFRQGGVLEWQEEMLAKYGHLEEHVEELCAPAT